MNERQDKTQNESSEELGLFPRGGPGLGADGMQPVLIAAVVLFTGALLATLVADMMPQEKKAPRTIGREKKREAARKKKAQWLDGTKAQAIERQLRVRSSTRRLIGGRYAALLYRHLNEAQDKCLIGPDGWLFAANRAELPQVSDELLARRSAAMLSAIWRRLAASGMEVLIVPVPRKAVIEQQHLPEGAEVRPAADALLIDEIRKLGVPVCDLFEAFGRSESNLYEKTDTHWNERAQNLAAEEVVRHLKLLAPDRTLATQVRENGTREAKIDLLRFAGLDRDSAREEAHHQPPVTVFDVFDGDQVLTHKNPAAMPRIALVGTSFSAKRKFPLLLEHYAGEPIWNGAVAAEETIFTLARFLDEHRDSLPRALILEMPNHQIFRKEPLTDAGLVFAAAPAPRTQLLATVPSDAHTRPLGTAREVKQEELLLSTPRGRLVHDGTGIVSLHLRGRVEGGDARLILKSGRQRFTVPWKNGVEELFVPLAGMPRQGGVEVSVEAARRKVAVRVTLDAAEFVCDLDLGGARTLRIEKDGDTQSLALDGIVPANAGLLLDVEGEAVVGLTIQDADGKELLRRKYRVSGKARAVVDLGGLADPPLEGAVVRLKGTGVAVTRARLAAPLR